MPIASRPQAGGNATCDGLGARCAASFCPSASLAPLHPGHGASSLQPRQLLWTAATPLAARPGQVCEGKRPTRERFPIRPRCGDLEAAVARFEATLSSAISEPAGAVCIYAPWLSGSGLSSVVHPFERRVGHGSPRVGVVANTTVDRLVDHISSLPGGVSCHHIAPWGCTLGELAKLRGGVVEPCRTRLVQQGDPSKCGQPRVRVRASLHLAAVGLNAE